MFVNWKKKSSQKHEPKSAGMSQIWGKMLDFKEI